MHVMTPTSAAALFCCSTMMLHARINLQTHRDVRVLLVLVRTAVVATSTAAGRLQWL